MLNLSHYAQNLRHEISRLQKSLSDPAFYELEGDYFYQGRNYPQRGRISVSNTMGVIGEIQDPNSRCPLHMVKGTFSFVDKLWKFNFTKIPSDLLISIFYTLGKLGTLEDGIEGEYHGLWAHQEKGILLKIGHKPGIGECVIVEHPESMNKASLILRKA